MFNQHFARALRLRRLYRHRQGRLFVVPLDHSISTGPLHPRGLDALVGELAAGGADAVVLHKGGVRQVSSSHFTHLSLIMHLSASTGHAQDPDAKYLVSRVDEALRLGADAVSMHVNIGSLDERGQITDLGAVARVCDEWNLPLLAMMYPRGPKISDPQDPALLAHVATLAADLGADLVKTPMARTVAEMRDVTASCPIPLIVAGGARMPDDDAVLSYVDNALLGGAAGVAMGRNVFASPDPAATGLRIAALLHGGQSLTVPMTGNPEGVVA